MSGIMGVFVGSASADKLQLSNQNLSYSDFGPGFVSYYLDSTGSVTTTPSGSNPNWVIPGTSAYKYQVLATLLSGTLTSGTTGTWLPLTSGRQWLVSQNSIGAKSASIRVDIALVGTTTPILATATITLYAQYLSG